MAYVIEKNITPPAAIRGRGTGSDFPFAEMVDVNDSFLVEVSNDPEQEQDNKLLVRRVRQAALAASRKYAPAKFSARKVDAGIRVFRIE